MKEKTTFYDKSHILIKKKSGEIENFSTSKLRISLIRSGADAETAGEIVRNIEEWVHPGITTKDIFKRAFSLLHRQKNLSAQRYKIKQALMELGPTGFPFETFIGQIFQHEGYLVEVGLKVQGFCISHEMDVIATGDKIQHLVECKFSEDQSKHINIQVPLYVRSRTDDIVRFRKSLPEFADFKFESWVVTNKRFSEESVDYGNCAGLHLLGWDYPAGNSLKELIEKYKIYPITTAVHLTRKEKQILMEQGIVSCSQVLQNKEILNQLNLTKKNLDLLLNEIHNICR